MRQLFMLVLSLSISGTLIGLFIFIIHPFTEKYFSKRWNYYIWLLVLARLLIPFSFRTDTLRIPNIEIRQNSAEQAIPIAAPALNADDNFAVKSKTLPGKNTPQIPASKFQSLSDSQLFFAAAYIWLIGVLAIFCFKQLQYVRFFIYIKKDCTPISDSAVLSLSNSFCAQLHIKKTPVIYESSSGLGPVTIGFWNPIIIVPREERNLTQFPFVLHHELIHISRKDLWYKWIYHLLLCIHWFNPVLYFIEKQINNDCELSCDEAILANLTQTGKKVYGNVLLDTAERTIHTKRSVFSTTLTEKRGNLKNRLHSILHYQKRTPFQLLFSACTFVLILLLSACSGITLLPQNLSSSIKNGTTSNIKDTFYAEDSDEKAFGILSQRMTSLSSLEAFLGYSASPDPSGDAWKVYDDEVLLTGKDIQEQWRAYNYSGGGNRISASGFLLYGSHSIIIAHASKETSMQIKTSFEMLEGKFKIVQILPDGTVLPINDTGVPSQQSITLKEGRNIIKMVGQGAKLKNLSIDYTSLKSSDFEKIYYSKQEEYIAQIKESVLSGKELETPLDKDFIIKNIYLLDEESVSTILNVLLTQNVPLSKEELLDLFIFSDAKLSSEYLGEAIKNKTIEPLSADTITELMPYLYGSYKVELLNALPTESFYDAFSESIPYLNSAEMKQCLEHYLDAGESLSYAQLEEILPYLSKTHIKQLDQKIKNIK